MAHVLCTATLLMRLANAGTRCTVPIKFDRMLNMLWMLISRCRWRRWRDDRMAMVGHSEGRKADDRFSTGTTESHACRRNGFPGGLPLVDSSLSRKEKENQEERIHVPRIKTRVFITAVNNAAPQSETSEYDFVRNLRTLSCSLSLKEIFILLSKSLLLFNVKKVWNCTV